MLNNVFKHWRAIIPAPMFIVLYETNKPAYADDYTHPPVRSACPRSGPLHSAK